MIAIIWLGDWEQAKQYFNNLYYKRTKKDSLDSKNMFTTDDALNALKQLEKVKGKFIAQIVERMYRLETNHFKSSQYKITGTAGMEQGKWSNVPSLDTIKLKDPVLGYRDYLIWNPNDFVFYLADYIERHSGNWARWNSTIASKQDEYRKRVNSVKNKFII